MFSDTCCSIPLNSDFETLFYGFAFDILSCKTILITVLLFSEYTYEIIRF